MLDLKIIIHVSFVRNPTPKSSSLPKWTPSKGFPLNFYRIGNDDRSDNALLGMDIGIMDERAAFWREIDAFSPSRNSIKEEL